MIERVITRRERTERLIAEGDALTLLRLIERGPCACLGCREDEPMCVCEMTAQQVRRAVSYAALKRGRVVRLKP